MILEASVELDVGAIRLAVDLNVDDEIVAILGPNGAGKTTLLRILAGLHSIAGGKIVIDGVVVDEPGTGTFVAAKDRRVGVVFQEYLLFPFLSARENVAFGLRARGVPKREARRRADEWLARLGLGDRVAALPGELSGGQSQRVALARAIVGEPHLLLLDEPLAALDVGARIEVRRELREHLTGVRGARLLVTHDPVDAAVLADRVVILEEGKIVQEGTMEEIALHPRSAYVAELVGLNLFRGVARDGVIGLSSGGEIVIADHDLEGDVCVTVHPRSVTILLDSPTTSARNQWHGTIEDLDDLGERVRIRIDGEVPIVAEVTPAAARELDLARGRKVVASVKATEVQAYPA